MLLRLLKSGAQKVKSALSTAGSALGGKISNLLGSKEINEETLEELEALLYSADLGVSTSMQLVDTIRNHPKAGSEELLSLLKKQVLEILQEVPEKQAPTSAPQVTLIVGVNGNGKTTSIAKLAKHLMDEGKSVLVGAADTFRAAAAEQLETWAKRTGADIVRGQKNQDPAAVAFDTVSAGLARKTDHVLIDTAGRLHTKTDLMQELEKIRKSCNKVLSGAPHDTWLVLDATTGQNAVDQAKIFNRYTPISGLILTKLDGTAKGGIAVAIQRELRIPIKFIGVGEGMDDLQPFNPESFVEALFS